MIHGRGACTDVADVRLIWHGRRHAARDAAADATRPCRTCYSKFGVATRHQMGKMRLTKPIPTARSMFLIVVVYSLRGTTHLFSVLEIMLYNLLSCLNIGLELLGCEPAESRLPKAYIARRTYLHLPADLLRCDLISHLCHRVRVQPGPRFVGKVRQRCVFGIFAVLTGVDFPARNPC